MGRYVLAIDQGTTSSRAILFDEHLNIAAQSQQEFPQHFPQSGWVEHDPEDIWNTVLASCRDVLTKVDTGPEGVVAVGITNQRETTVVWDRETGKPIHNAIVWQDRRTANACQALKDAEQESDVSKKTGLLLDPYFSATKIAWLLDHVEGARTLANDGKLAFGTIDTFLLWRLTGGKVHATDATNASRTMLYDIHDNGWSEGLCSLFKVPMSLLPEVRDCASNFGTTASNIFGASIPITGIAGDQQAAAIGQACFEPGMVKSTYGTGCFALMNTGRKAVASTNRLLTTIACRLAGETTYALEGSIFIAGAAVQWLRDGLGLISEAHESDALAASADDGQDVYLVPAFVGLGAPHWDADCRGALVGLTRATGPAEIARSALASVCYQTRDLIDAMQRDQKTSDNITLRVDGGMAKSDWTMQHLADILDAPVDRPPVLETTALGAAWLAGSHIGFYPEKNEFAATWVSAKQFIPTMDSDQRDRLYAGWTDAVRRTLTRPADA